MLGAGGGSDGRGDPARKAWGQTASGRTPLLPPRAFSLRTDPFHRFLISVLILEAWFFLIVREAG